MIRVDWHSILGVLALVTVSGCAVGTSGWETTDSDDDQEHSSSSATGSIDDVRELGAIDSRGSTLPLRANTEPPPVASGAVRGPHPEPWSSKPD